MTPITTQTLENALTAKLMVSFGKTAAEATDGEMMRASALVLRDMMALREVETRQKARQRHARQVHYLSLEFLMGRSLMKNAYNLGLLPQLREALEHLGFKAADIFEIEPDAALGNGGLGRLAACFWIPPPRRACRWTATASGTSTACSGSILRMASRKRPLTTGSALETHGAFAGRRMPSPCSSAGRPCAPCLTTRLSSATG